MYYVSDFVVVDFIGLKKKQRDTYKLPYEENKFTSFFLNGTAAEII